jgi:Skp family chaperone for outer membrane proteins
MKKARDTNAEQKAQERTLRLSIIEEQRALHERLSQAIEAAAGKIGEIEGYTIEPESLARWYRRTKGGHSI